MSDLFAYGLGLSHLDGEGRTLDCLFPAPVLHPGHAACRLMTEVAGSVAPEAARWLADRLNDLDDDAVRPLARVARRLAEADRPLTAVALKADTAIDSTAEAYLKLHLLSHRLTLPNTLNLDGIFAHLPNVAWTSDGPVASEELADRLLDARLAGRHLEVTGIDKFPRMTNYVVPGGVRIADASRIRLGAYLGDGTTVMHEGFVNFNAGALGPNMIEGRISQGVVVKAHSDLGGSSSTMGTLSGGGDIRITIGEHCLIGANAGTGIPLGDRCTIEAGLYITAATPVRIVTADRTPGEVVKARVLAGESDLLFLRNGQTGAIECRTNRQAIALNAELHAHN